MPDQLVEQIAGLAGAELQQRGQCRQDTFRIQPRGEGNEYDPVGKPLLVLLGYSGGQPGLADAAGADQGQQSGVGIVQQVADLTGFLCTPDEGC